ncbi:hypothetical protein NPIL_624911 [Nephila pilipes]|uniref:Uncharacterized protein n=1 Tax=Nephila pilipes TaxID=299642 RepID=A0A8X6N914_NEPPI|nr:hypothetical protein NPIL_624911 [Nephila pilipes]
MIVFEFPDGWTSPSIMRLTFHHRLPKSSSCMCFVSAIVWLSSACMVDCMPYPPMLMKRSSIRLQPQDRILLFGEGLLVGGLDFPSNCLSSDAKQWPKTHREESECLPVAVGWGHSF